KFLGEGRQTMVPRRVLAGPKRPSGFTACLDPRLEVCLEVIQHEQDRLVLQRSDQVLGESFKARFAGKSRRRFAVNCVGRMSSGVIVVEPEFVSELDMDITQRGIEGQGVRFGLK